MRKIFLLVFVFNSYCWQVLANSNMEDLWKRGNSYYSQKIYDSAAVCYEQIAALKPKSAQLFCCLGNTYYRLNKIAHAVLNYERALQIDPDNKQVQENLLLTRSRISNQIIDAKDIFFIEWWKNITRQDKATFWAVFDLIIFLLIIGILCLKRFNKQLGSKIPAQLFFALGFSWVCMIVFASVAAKRSSEPGLAVVMQNETPLMSNNLSGKPITTIPEGTTVQIVSNMTGWIEVTIPDGRKGFIQETLLTKI